MADRKPRRPDAGRQQFVERLAGVLAASDLPRMPALVFAQTYVDDADSVTAAELAEGLGVSPASVSAAVRHLLELGMVVRERRPGERQDRIRAADDAWVVMIRRRDRELAAWQQQLREGVAVLGRKSVAGKRMRRALPVFDTVLSERAATLDAVTAD